MWTFVLRPFKEGGSLDGGRSQAPTPPLLGMAHGGPWRNEPAPDASVAGLRCELRPRLLRAVPAGSATGKERRTGRGCGISP